MKATDIFNSSNEMDLTPMIDVVFLLLVFFMVTTQLTKQEADLGIELPSQAAPKAAAELPSRHIIDIMPDGSIFINGGPSGDDGGHDLPALTSTLANLRASADRMNKKTVVTIQADSYSPHYRAIDVLNACARANLSYVSFSRM